MDSESRAQAARQGCGGGAPAGGGGRMRVRAAAIALALAAAACGRGDSARGPRVVGVSKQINEFLYDIHARVGARRARPHVDLSAGDHAASVGGISSRAERRRDHLDAADDAADRWKSRARCGGGQVKKVGIPVLVLAPGSTPRQRAAPHEAAREGVPPRGGGRQRRSCMEAGMDAVLRDSAKWARGHRPRVLVMHFGQIVNDYLGAQARIGRRNRSCWWAGGVNAIDSTGG